MDRRVFMSLAIGLLLSSAACTVLSCGSSGIRGVNVTLAVILPRRDLDEVALIVW